MTAVAVTAPLATGRACGKLILLGEHFVVHGTEALAVPLGSVATTVEVWPVVFGGGRLEAPDLTRPEDQATAQTLLEAALARLITDTISDTDSVTSSDSFADTLSDTDTVTETPAAMEALLGARAAAAAADPSRPTPPWRVLARSTIPVGHGLGSSAALSVALIRAIAAASNRLLTDSAVNAHAHALEILVHGTPSGVDDTVVTFERPVRFSKHEGMREVVPGAPFHLVLGSCGHGGCTRDAVASVTALAGAEPDRFARLRAEATRVIADGIAAFEAGDAHRLGPLLDQNHALLQEVGVSAEKLDRLAQAARDAGALGAKMTGGGLGGFVFALADPSDTTSGARIAAALQAAGAAGVFHAEVAP